MRTLGHRIVGQSPDGVGLGHREPHVARGARTTIDGRHGDSAESCSTPVVLGECRRSEGPGSACPLGPKVGEGSIGLSLGFLRSPTGRLGDLARPHQRRVDLSQLLVPGRRGLEEFESPIVELVTTGRQNLHLVLDGFGFSRRQDRLQLLVESLAAPANLVGFGLDAIEFSLSLALERFHPTTRFDESRHVGLGCRGLQSRRQAISCVEGLFDRRVELLQGEQGDQVHPRTLLIEIAGQPGGAVGAVAQVSMSN